MAAVFRRYVEHRNRYVRKAAHARCHRRLGYALACSGEEEKIRDSRVYAAYTDGLPVAISRHIRALTEELHFAGNIELLRHLLPEEEERDELLVQTLVVRYLDQPTLRELLAKHAECAATSMIGVSETDHLIDFIGVELVYAIGPRVLPYIYRALRVIYTLGLNRWAWTVTDLPEIESVKGCTEPLSKLSRYFELLTPILSPPVLIPATFYLDLSRIRGLDAPNGSYAFAKMRYLDHCPAPISGLTEHWLGFRIQTGDTYWVSGRDDGPCLLLDVPWWKVVWDCATMEEDFAENYPLDGKKVEVPLAVFAEGEIDTVYERIGEFYNQHDLLRSVTTFATLRYARRVHVPAIRAVIDTEPTREIVAAAADFLRIVSGGDDENMTTVESVFGFAYANNMPCLFKTAFAAAHFYRYGKIPATLAGGSGDDSREERELESGLEERYSTPENLLLVAQRRLAGIREMADVKMIVDRALLSGDAATLAQVSLPLLKSTENVCRLVSPFVLGP